MVYCPCVWCMCVLSVYGVCVCGVCVYCLCMTYVCVVCVCVVYVCMVYVCMVSVCMVYVCIACIWCMCVLSVYGVCVYCMCGYTLSLWSWLSPSISMWALGLNLCGQAFPWQVLYPLSHLTSPEIVILCMNISMYVCMHVHMCVHVCVCVCLSVWTRASHSAHVEVRGRSWLQESVLSFHYISSKDPTQVVRLSSASLHPGIHFRESWNIILAYQNSHRQEEAMLAHSWFASGSDLVYQPSTAWGYPRPVGEVRWAQSGVIRTERRS
jgi:hypothetical protein